MINNSTSKQIKIFLIKSNQTQTKLAESLNISKQQLNAIINGRQENIFIESKLLSIISDYYDKRTHTNE
jgi:plasmid maintenance system antidote protein VapI